MCVFDMISVEHRILLTKKCSGILSGVVYFFVAFCPAVNFSSWHFVRVHLVRGILCCGILSRGIMSGIPVTKLVLTPTLTLNDPLSQNFTTKWHGHFKCTDTANGNGYTNYYR